MMGQTEKEKKELIRLRDEKKYQTIYLDELPRHLVTVPSFFMGKYPITQAQWHIVATSYQKVIQELNPTPSHFKGDRLPVEQVSWDDAQEFCRRLSNQHTTRTYRLPSESEWEYACSALPISLAGTFRSGDVLNEGDLSFPFHFGETIDASLANYCAQNLEIHKEYYPGVYDRGVLGEYRERTTEVKTFLPNAFGLYDLHGNVLEWCEDDWHSNYQNAPDDGSAWVESDRKNANRLLRGGSWRNYPLNCRSASRASKPRASCLNYLGFRVCCDVGGFSSP